MIDMKPLIEAKSDQLNSDDLIGGPMTITITAVKTSDAKDQPLCVFYDGDRGKPWKPCKSMRRAMVALWGDDGNAYVGRSLTLYRDATVKWGGEEVGGIRISHMSHINKQERLSLTATRGQKRPFVVSPLVMQQTPKTHTDPLKSLAADIRNEIKATTDATDLWLLWDERRADDLKKIVESSQQAYDFLKKTYDAKQDELKGL